MGFKNMDEVLVLVEAARNATLSPDDFGHREHLALGAALLLEVDLEVDRAATILRPTLQNLLEVFGVPPTEDSGYHETLTVGWLHLIAGILARASTESPIEQVNQVCEELGNKRLLLEYYSRPLIMSPEARRDFVEPDLRAFQAE